jgi:hypothetical protein
VKGRGELDGALEPAVGDSDGAGLDAAVGCRSGGTIDFVEATSCAGVALRSSAVIHICRMNRNIATARNTRQRILRSFIHGSQARSVLAAKDATSTQPRADVSADAHAWRSIGLSSTYDG